MVPKGGAQARRTGAPRSVQSVVAFLLLSGSTLLRRHHCRYRSRSLGGAFFPVILIPSARPASLCHCHRKKKPELIYPMARMPTHHATRPAQGGCTEWTATKTMAKSARATHFAAPRTYFPRYKAIAAGRPMTGSHATRTRALSGILNEPAMFCRNLHDAHTGSGLTDYDSAKYRRFMSARLTPPLPPMCRRVAPRPGVLGQAEALRLQSAPEHLRTLPMGRVPSGQRSLRRRGFAYSSTEHPCPSARPTQCEVDPLPSSPLSTRWTRV